MCSGWSGGSRELGLSLISGTYLPHSLGQATPSESLFSLPNFNMHHRLPGRTGLGIRNGTLPEVGTILTSHPPFFPAAGQGADQ